MTLVTKIASLIRAFGRAYSRKWSFLGVFLVVFLVSFGTLAAFDIVPEAAEKKSDALVAAPVAATVAEVPTVYPELIEIPSIKLSVKIANPQTTDVETLDHELLSGAVRYPTSAKVGEDGNVIIFGHSSYLPVVNNKSFKAFNDIQKLKEGDRITVTGEGYVYVYAVETVTQADAESAAIPLTVTGKKLTLATCDSFGKKTDRFIVTANLVESYPLAS
ncbi:MAG: Peptidase sortase-like protein [Parcubacteria group bacterium]|nr:Peptidase sortase-like protein [Parcubacteria group bacterium]